MSFTSESPRAGQADESQLDGYRTISVAAILALVLGVASSLALAYWLLLIVPAMAIVVAIVALRQIQTEGSNLTGRGLALTGLALALIFGIWAPTRLASRDQHLYSQAQGYADEWFDLIHHGKLYDAHQLTLHEAERQPPGTTLENFYEKSSEALQKYDRFYKEGVLKNLLPLGDQVTYEFVGRAGIPPLELTGQVVLLDYRAKWEEQGKPKSKVIRVAMERQNQYETNDYLWRVRDVLAPKPD